MRKSTLFVVACSVVALLLPTLATATDPPFPINWQGMKAPIPQSRYWAGQCEYAGKIYVFGGISEDAAGNTIALNTVYIYDTATDAWTRGADMPTARYLPTASAVNGKIYVIGGRAPDAANPGNFVNYKINEEYDPATNTWTNKAAILQAGRGFADAVLNNKIYIFGGNTTAYQTSVRIYDPATNTWSSGADMTGARAYGRAVAVPGTSLIYYIGGDNGGTTPTSFLGVAIVYDTTSNTWTSTRINMIDKVSIFAASYDAGTNAIYVFSGHAYDLEGDLEYRGVSGNVQKLDLATNTFSLTTPSPAPYARPGAGASAVNGKIYLVGGTSNTGYTFGSRMALVDVFDPATQEWYEPNTPLATYNCIGGNLVAADSKLYYLNGVGQDVNESVWEYAPGANEWTEVAANPVGRESGVAAVWNGKIIESGGYAGGAATGDTQLFDPATASFQVLTPDPTAAIFACGSVVGNGFYVFGGSTTAGDLLKTARKLDLNTNTWSSLPDLPVTLDYCSAVTLNNKIYIVGGEDNSSDNQLLNAPVIFDPAANSYSTGAGMPVPVFGPSATVYNGYVIVHGGYNRYKQDTSYFAVEAPYIQVYDPVGNSWTSKDLPYARYAHSAAVLGSRLYVTGGYQLWYSFLEPRLDIAALAEGPAPPTLSLGPSSQSIVVGSNATITATLSEAQATDTVVTLGAAALQALDAIVTVPASVTILASQTSATFQVTGVGVGSATITGTLPADLGSGTASAQVTVTGIPTFQLTPGTLSIGVGATGSLTATLGASQPAAVTVALSSSATGVATVPASVSVAAGSTTATFQVTGVAAGDATITATLPAALGGASATALVTVTSAPPPSIRYFVPSVAHLPGASNTKWRTDVAVVNLSTSAATLTLTYYPGSSGSPVVRSATLAAGATTEYQDILVGLFGYAADANTSGALKIESNVHLGITSRTYNQKTATETFGQYYPAIIEPKIWTIGDRGVLPGIKKTTGFRTNIGALNIGDAAASVVVKLYGADAAKLGNDVTINVPAGRWVQQNDIFGAAGVTSADIAYANIEVQTADAKIWAYASVIDATTGDPTTIPILTSLDTAIRIVPSVAHSPGKSNTKWRTDVAAVNPFLTTATITMTYYDYVGSAPVVRTTTLAPGATIEWRDILVSLFGAADEGSTKGTVKIESNVELDVVSRTYNQKSATETFGQYYPALSDVRALELGEKGVLPQLKKNAGFRTNVGAVNVGAAACNVLVKLYGSDASKLGNDVTLSVPAGKWIQQDDIFAAAGVASADIAYASVEVTTEGGKVWAYGSVIDNTTGDPTTIPLLYLPLGLF